MPLPIVTIENNKYTLEPCVSLICDSPLRRERALTEIIKSLGSSELVLRVQLSTQAPEKLFEILNTPDLFSPRRLFLISDCETAPTKLIERLVLTTQSDPNLRIIFIAEKATPKAAIRLNVPCKVELFPLEAGELSRWIMAEFKRQGFNNRATAPLDERLIQTIQILGENSPDQIARIVEQLLLYCESHQTPQLADLKVLFSNNPHLDEFKAIEIIASNSIQQITHFISAITNQESNAFGLLGLIFKSLVDLQKLSELSTRRMGIEEMSASLGKPKWLIQKQQQLLSKLKSYNFELAFDHILQTGLALRRTAVSEIDLLTQLALALRPSALQNGQTKF